MKKILVGAAFKMNKTVEESIEYAEKLDNFIREHAEVLKNIDIFILPTFLSLYTFSKQLSDSKLKFGAQNCFWEDEGAYTGEVSPMHLKKIGCTYVELGHPERLNILKEDESMINKKIIGCLRNKLKPVLCIGEEKEHQDRDEVHDFLKKQIRGYFKDVKAEEVNNIILAYEPVWAIGADRSASVEYIHDSLIFIRNFLDSEYGENTGKNQLIIYGGSVNPESAFEIIRLDDSNGIFIGRAALNYDYFIKMVKMAIEVNKLGAV
ncbi:MAG: triose-phosphate isomerase [Actinobacteria bacterium]|nr:triose-phosphate isomerase [Actinomycetota bacterium]